MRPKLSLASNSDAKNSYTVEVNPTTIKNDKSHAAGIRGSESAQVYFVLMLLIPRAILRG